MVRRDGRGTQTFWVRVCVDLKPLQLNEGVLHEFHPLNKVEETLGQLNGAMIFSKLDANSGFWQIQLARKSKLSFITIYNTFREVATILISYTYTLWDI